MLARQRRSDADSKRGYYSCGSTDMGNEATGRAWTLLWLCCLLVPVVVFCGAVAVAKNRASDVRTTTHTIQCELCHKWFESTFFRRHHQPGMNCVPVTAVINAASQLLHQEHDEVVGELTVEEGSRERVVINIETTPAIAPAAAAPARDAAPAVAPSPATGRSMPTADAIPPERALQQDVNAFLCANLSKSKLQQLLDLFKRQPNVGYKPSHLQASKLIEQSTEEYLGPGFKHVDIRPMLKLNNADHHQPVIVSVRTNPMQLVQELLNTCPKNEPGRTYFSKHAQPLQTPDDSSRLFNEFWTGKKWEEAERSQKAKAFGKHPILWLVLWSDKVSYDRMNRSKGHPVSLSIGNTAVEYQRTADGCRLLALLPIAKPLKNEKDNSTSFKQRKAHILQVAMKVAIEELKASAANSELLNITWPDGSCDLCTVQLAAFLADLEEQWDLLGLKHAGTTYPDIQYLIPASELTNMSKPISEWPRRTEKDHKERLQIFHSMKEMATSIPAAARAHSVAALERISMNTIPYEVALWDFGPGNNIYGCFPVDRLHQDYNGVTVHLLAALELCLEDKHGKGGAETIATQINGRLQEMRGLHEAFYPTDGLACKFAMAEERRGLMRFAAIAMNGLVDDHITKLFAEYARWQQLRDKNTHTETSLQQLEIATKKLVTDIVAIFGHVKNFNFPKIANMRKYPDVIREFGMISFSDTGPKESLNKGLRATYMTTNKKFKGLTEQVANKVHLTEALKAAATGASSSAGAAASSRHVGARQRAALSWQPSMSTDGRTFNFSRAASDTSSWEFTLLEKVPELTHLQTAVAKLMDDQEPPLNMPASVILKATLGLPRVEGVVDIIRGHPEITGRTQSCMSLCDVAFACILVRHNKEERTTGYGQVYAIGTANGVDFVFLKAYAEASADTSSCLTFQPLVWEHPQRPAKKAKTYRVCTVQGSFWALTTDMLSRKVCIVPNYKIGHGHFLVNDLVDQV